MHTVSDRPPEIGGHEYRAIINGRPISIGDHEPRGSHLLAAAHFEPVTDYILIEKATVGSRLISLDETVKLDRLDATTFFAFEGGEVFLFSVNGHGFQWGRPSITEHELRDIARVPEQDILLQERPDHEPIVIEPGATISLSAKGAEHFRTESRFIKVFYENEPKEIERGTYTTEQLLDLFKVDPGYLLNLKRKDGLETLKPGELLKVKAGMEFFSQPPGGGSS